jgi:hypothetical protein
MAQRSQRAGEAFARTIHRRTRRWKKPNSQMSS